MNRYHLTRQLGDGTYGFVLLATSLETKEKVAVKKYVSITVYHKSTE